MARHSAEEDLALLRVHAGALARFGRHVREVADDQWEAPTPCTDWTVRDLVNHLTAEQLWVPELLAGARVSDIGDRFDGDVLGHDPAAAWTAAEEAARAAFAFPGALARTVHLSYGDRGADGYCREMAVDAVVHAWDLAEGLGADSRMDPEAADFALAEVSPIADGLASSGLFAPPVQVAAGADAQARLLGLMGRDADDPFRRRG